MMQRSFCKYSLAAILILLAGLLVGSCSCVGPAVSIGLTPPQVPGWSPSVCCSVFNTVLKTDQKLLM